MKILISTGVYPPNIGGPAEYTKNLKNALELGQNRVKIATFGLEAILPTGLRHLWFMAKILPRVLWADSIVIMDTFSVALPTVFLAKVFNKKTVIRTGGDFLWEQYLERTKKKVLLGDFYINEFHKLSFKERTIFKLTKWTIKNSTKIIFSTNWQKEIFIKAYSIPLNKVGIIENYYGDKEPNLGFKSKSLVASTRNISLKNLDLLNEIFEEIKKEGLEVSLFTQNVPYDSLVRKIKDSYAVILISIGDISPNLILDSIRLNKPFICTKEIGILDRIKDAGIFVDPLNKAQIKNEIINLLDEKNYSAALSRVESFSYTHSWNQIAEEFLNILK